MFSFCLVTVDRNRKLIKNQPIMDEFAHNLTSYRLFLDEGIRSNFGIKHS